MSSSFFHPGPVICPIYRQIRDSDDPLHVMARSNLERLWQVGAPYIDEDASKKATEHLPTVFWELMLADTFMRQGRSLVPRVRRTPRTEGPDLFISDPPVWIEAVMPRGRDALAQKPLGLAFDFPADAFTFRLTSVLDTKSKKLLHYANEGWVKPGDATVIAVSGARLKYRFQEPLVPRIVSAVYAAGPMEVFLDRSTGERKGHNFQERLSATNANGRLVNLSLFRNADAKHVSAVLYNFSDWITPSDSGYALIHNHFATNRLPRGWLGIGQEFWAEESQLCSLTYSDHSRS